MSSNGTPSQWFRLREWIAVAFLAVFGITFVAIMSTAHFNVTVNGNLDPNMIWSILIGVVIGIFSWLGFQNRTTQPVGNS